MPVKWVEITVVKCRYIARRKTETVWEIMDLTRQNSTTQTGRSVVSNALLSQAKQEQHPLGVDFTRAVSREISSPAPLAERSISPARADLSGTKLACPCLCIRRNIMSEPNSDEEYGEGRRV